MNIGGIDQKNPKKYCQYYPYCWYFTFKNLYHMDL